LESDHATAKTVKKSIRCCSSENKVSC
jgi:hypothetical protein